MRCLLYNFIALRNNFLNTLLCTTIYSDSNTCSTTTDKIHLNTTQFNSINIDTITETSDYKTVDSGNYFIKNYYSYLILLYNIYNYDENTLMDIIEYCIYNKSSTTDDFSDDYLNIKLDKIKTQINRNATSDLIIIYKNNSYIVKFIVKLLTIFISKIKYDIETNAEGGSKLCMPSNLNKNAKEQMIYDYILNNFTITPTSITSITAKSGLIKTEDIRVNISKYCTYFFNICLYLLRSSLNNSMDPSMRSVTDAIISNYKFYNTEDTDNIDLTELRKELKINCNYFNKYNNINTKQILMMKNNTDAVAYNFPVLLVILFVFLGESLFIKS